MINATPRPVLSKVEFNFESVQDAELIPCCLWEYARESRKVRELASRIMNGYECAPATTCPAELEMRVIDDAKGMRDQLLTKSSEIQVVNSDADMNKAAEVGKDLKRYRKLEEKD